MLHDEQEAWPPDAEMREEDDKANWLAEREADLKRARDDAARNARAHNLVEDERFALKIENKKLRNFLRQLADSLNPVGYEIGIAAHCTDPYKVAMSVRAGDCGSDQVCQRVFRLLGELKQYGTFDTTRSLPALSAAPETHNT